MRYGFKHAGKIFLSAHVQHLMDRPEAGTTDFSGNLLNRPERVDEGLLPTLVRDGYEIVDLDAADFSLDAFIATRTAQAEADRRLDELTQVDPGSPREPGSAIPPAPKPLDLSRYKSAVGAAKALYEWACRESAGQGQSPAKEVILRKPFDRDESWAAGAWHVLRESGPYEWAIHLTGGESIYVEEMGRMAPPEVIGFRNPTWDADVGFSFSIVFRG